MPAASPAPADAPPGPVRRWVLGARPRTLAAAAVPVMVGTCAGWWSASPSALGPAPEGAGGSGWFLTGMVDGPGHVLWWRALAALVVALAVQVGTNYANDYSDGVRGTDTGRVGPVRLVASGLAAPSSVRLGAVACFGVAGVAGLALAAVTSWWLVPVGAVCFAAGWLYTGGPKPYGYLGLGELFVFVFFGMVATVGSWYVQHPHLAPGALPAGAHRPLALSYDHWLALWLSIPVGLLATALLEANNIRDIAGDRRAGKRTLAVRLGRRRAGWLYVALMVGTVVGVALVAAVRPWALLALLALPLAVRPVRTALSDAEGSELLGVLGATGRLQLAVGLLLCVGILV
ncbi:MAG: 1,4-dihydroxy-2-naphthoate polyprenyltransferase [Acidimicrobiales bacterium]